RSRRRNGCADARDCSGSTRCSPSASAAEARETRDRSGGAPRRARAMGVEVSRFRGVGPALITPMHEDGSLDLEGFAAHVRYCVDGGVHFVVPCGTTGESATMDADEQARVIDRCVAAAAGRVPVMAGAG